MAYSIIHLGMPYDSPIRKKYMKCQSINYIPWYGACLQIRVQCIPEVSGMCPLNQFKRRFSRLCANISADAKSRTSWRFKSVSNLFLNNIYEDRSPAPSCGSVSREIRNVPPSGPSDQTISVRFCETQSAFSIPLSRLFNDSISRRVKKLWVDRLFSLLRERILILDTSLHNSDSTDLRCANGTLAGKFGGNLHWCLCDRSASVRYSRGTRQTENMKKILPQDSKRYSYLRDSTEWRKY
jgi:hypothetical protein